MAAGVGEPPSRQSAQALLGTLCDATGRMEARQHESLVRGHRAVCVCLCAYVCECAARECIVSVDLFIDKSLYRHNR